MLWILLLLPTTSQITCISCTSDSANSSCYQNPNSPEHDLATCNGECQVWTLLSEVRSEVYMFERSCSETCKTGCTHIADMEHRFIGCGTCCGQDICNLGNSDASRIPTMYYYTAVLIIFIRQKQ